MDMEVGMDKDMVDFECLLYQSWNLRPVMVFHIFHIRSILKDYEIRTLGIS